jgi:hypothetical protein
MMVPEGLLRTPVSQVKCGEHDTTVKALAAAAAPAQPEQC